MFEIMVQSQFSAVHHLEHYAGQCSQVHGHRWKVRLLVSGAAIDEEGMLLPAGELRRLLEDVLRRFESCDLNRDPLFASVNPSAENLAAWIFDTLKDAPLITSGAGGARLHAVEVEETPGSVARHLGA